ncbi:MAG: hypothetical protein ACRESZ_02510 [Methylococcales bacterium]
MSLRTGELLRRMPRYREGRLPSEKNPDIPTLLDLSSTTKAGFGNSKPVIGIKLRSREAAPPDTADNPSG